ncbi:larval cuticle protein 1-like [Zophobas morio]|uniref:larval cuticle protein 1-like n=1 Tax=Zophobas morio TaxID=2755281 RepID=UPI0030828F75
MEASLAVALVVLSVFLHGGSGRPPIPNDEPSNPPNNQIVFYKNHQRSNGYQFEYVAEDGSRRQEIATLEDRENETEPVLHVKGTYEYSDGDGRKYVVNYEADDKGMKHEGDIVPPREKAWSITP